MYGFGSSGSSRRTIQVSAGPAGRWIDRRADRQTGRQAGRQQDRVVLRSSAEGARQNKG